MFRSFTTTCTVGAIVFGTIVGAANPAVAAPDDQPVATVGTFVLQTSTSSVERDPSGGPGPSAPAPTTPTIPITPRPPTNTPTAPVEPAEPAAPRPTTTPSVPTGPVVEAPVDFNGTSAELLNSVVVSTDSVVAHALVQADFSRSITVRWGDGAVTTRNFTSNADVRHAYEDENEGDPFSYFVTIEAKDFDGNISTEIRRVDLVPRYSVVAYNASFTPLEHCDPFYEKNSEWDITQKLDGQEINFFEDNRQTSAGIGTTGILVTFDLKRMPGSLVRREMIKSDPGFNINWRVVEDDTWWDDLSGSLNHRLHPTTGNGTRDVILDRDCRSRIVFDYESILLRPDIGLGGPVATQ